MLDIILKDVQNRIEDKKIKLEVTEEVKKYIVENEIDLSYGARQLKRKVQEIIENKIAKEIVEGNLNQGEIIEFYTKQDEIQYKICKKI